MRGYAAIGLHLPKNTLNVGSALRAASCYGAAFVATSGRRYRRAPTDPRKVFRHMPLLAGVEDLRSVIPFDCVPVAVDLVPDATPLQRFEHPERAFYVFGPEDGTLGAAVLKWCPRKVYVPTDRCMNLAATVNVVLYSRALRWGFPAGVAA